MGEVLFTRHIIGEKNATVEIQKENEVITIIIFEPGSFSARMNCRRPDLLANEKGPLT